MALLKHLSAALLYFGLAQVSARLLGTYDHAVLFWPAAGLALIVVWILGYRSLVAVFSGSVAHHFVMLQDELHWQQALTLSGFGLGSSLQAAAGAWSFSRFAKNLKPENYLKSAARFAFLIVPAVSLISATIAAAVLHATGQLAGSPLLDLWLTWWTGNGVGTLLVIPLLLHWRQNGKPQWTSTTQKTNLAILGFSVLACFLVTRFHNVEIEKYRKSSVYLENFRMQKNIQKVVRGVEDKLVDLRNHVLIVYPDSKKIHEFLRAMVLSKSPKMTMSWNPFIAQSQRKAFEAENAVIRERDPQGRMIRAKNREHYIVVQFIEPKEENRAAIGYDVHSDRVRRAAMDKALATRESFITAKVDLVQNGKAAFLMFVPAFKQEGFIGFSTGVLAFDELIEKSADPRFLQNFRFMLRDVTEEKPQPLFYNDEGIAFHDGASSEIFEVFKRQWQLLSLPRTSFIQDISRSSDHLTLLLVAVLIALPVGIALVISENRLRLESVVRKRTGDLRVALDDQRREAEKRTRAEAQLRQSQKMETLGTLAGGIAHDFNNSLSVISGALELVQKRTQEQPPNQKQIARYLEIARNAGKSAQKIISRIMTFARRKELENSPVDAYQLFLEIKEMLPAFLPTSIHLNFRSKLRPGQAWVEVDPHLIQEMVVNLANNSREAMNGKGSLMVQIDLSNLETMCSSCQRPFGGKHLEIAVSDDGPGIPSKMIPRIFDPYFGTKKTSGGTGLGLSMVHGIAHDLRGHVLVLSPQGRGVRVSLLFPTCPPPASQETGSTPGTATGKTNPKVLLVDDEKDLLELEKEALEDMGCTVHAFSHPQQAWSYFEKNSANLDVLLTDQTMPDITGLELIKKIKSVDPEFPVFLYSGNLEKSISDEIKQMPGADCTVKPLDLESLYWKIERMVAGSGRR